MPLTPTPVRGDLLTEAQLLGRACVFCGESVGPGNRRHVGSYGHEAWRLYACPSCGARKRLPVWPEYGSA